jgi:hypothetical protein
MGSLDKFWLGTDVHGTPEVTDEMVLAVESKLGVKLPASLVILLKTLNGGYPRKAGFMVPEGPNAECIEQPFEVGLIHSLKEMVYEGGLEDAPTGLIEFGCGEDTSARLCLDYRGVGPDGEPRVVWERLWGRNGCGDSQLSHHRRTYVGMPIPPVMERATSGTTWTTDGTTGKSSEGCNSRNCRTTRFCRTRAK